MLPIEQGCAGEGQWGHDLDFNHRAGSLETSGGLLEAVLHRGGWSSAARVWGQGAVTAGDMQQYRAPKRRRPPPEGLTGAQPASQPASQLQPLACLSTRALHLDPELGRRLLSAPAWVGDWP